MSGTSGNDTLNNGTATNVIIYGYGGNDSIYSNNGSYLYAYVTIDAGEGNDTITGRFGNSSISGGAGDDKISMTGDVDRATVNPGTGNDTVYMDNYDGRNVYQYASGDGNDIIYGLLSWDTLHITSGSISNSVLSGNDVIFYVGSGSITLKVKNTSFYLKIGSGEAKGVVFPLNMSLTSGGDYLTNVAERATINALAGNDTIYNYGDSVRVYGGDGNDYLSNSGNYSMIDGGAGNDSIYNYNLYYSTIDGGAGADTIYSYYSYSSINGGADADRISLDSSSYSSSYGKNTVLGGGGNDTVWLNSTTTLGNVYQYASGDGYDTIYGVTNYDNQRHKCHSERGQRLHDSLQRQQ